MERRKSEASTADEITSGPPPGTQGKGPSGPRKAAPWKFLPGAAAVVIAAALAYCFLLALPGALPWAGSDGRGPGPPFMYSFSAKDALSTDVSVMPDGYSAYSSPPWGDDDVFSLLVVGRDKDYSKDGGVLAKSHGRADTIMVLLMPRNKMSVTLLSIPRDTLVVSKDDGTAAKMNSLYRALLPVSLMDAVAELTGVEIDRWVCLDFEGFAAIVDILGGVDVEVAGRMKYTDKAGGYSIDLYPGTYHFDGAEALSYIRYRNDAMGDIGRVERQLDLVKKLAGKAMLWDTAGRLFGLVLTVGRNVASDLDLDEAFAVGVRLLRIGSSYIDAIKVPGGFVGPYWRADLAKLRRMLEDAIL
ncbi:MAG: putative transcriptional regulator YvhJ [Firmicutes bacterium ADurb.Bin153]|nr:MAG: putative transcriptional regulator YvhJ [Firmicutes bacterium ADurb.Bin153]